MSGLHNIFALLPFGLYIYRFYSYKTIIVKKVMTWPNILEHVCLKSRKMMHLWMSTHTQEMNFTPPNSSFRSIHLDMFEQSQYMCVNHLVGFLVIHAYKKQFKP